MKDLEKIRRERPEIGKSFGLKIESCSNRKPREGNKMDYAVLIQLKIML